MYPEPPHVGPMARPAYQAPQIAEYVDHWMRAYQEANARYGWQLQLGENLALGLWCYVADTHEQAKRALKPFFEEHVNLLPPWGCCAIVRSRCSSLVPRVSPAISPLVSITKMSWPKKRGSVAPRTRP